MKSLIVSLLLVVLASADPTVSPTPCPGFNGSFNVDSISFGDFSTSRYHRAAVEGSWAWYDDYIYLPQNVQSAILTALGAVSESFYWGVPCDNGTLTTSYPDLVFSINGENLNIEAQKYIATDFSWDEGVCEVLIGENIDDTTDIVFPYFLESTICELEQTGTEDADVKKSRPRRIRGHKRRPSTRKQRMARRQQMARRQRAARKH
ncbi:hypothetical protein M3Y99_01511600 [Aphelenchoides fujianensis]|nr:hypothetical protein M3Y99_01511600 [Aphelenchoides fujianensis]